MKQFDSLLEWKSGLSFAQLRLKLSGITVQIAAAEAAVQTFVLRQNREKLGDGIEPENACDATSSTTLEGKP